MDVDVNMLAVLVAAVSGMVVGTMWYGPLFGKPWMALMGFTRADMEKAQKEGMWKTYVKGFLVQFITAYVVAHFIALLGITDVSGALQFSFWAWLGLVATSQFNSVVWEGRPVKLYAINAANILVAVAVMSIIIVSM